MNKKFKLALILSSALLVINLPAFGSNPITPKEHKKLWAGTPVANFVANDSIICIGDSVHFTDLSTNTPTSWSWTFAGGTPATSILQNPTVVYSSSGTFAVTLTATNGSGSNTLTKNNYIVVNPKPIVVITGSSAAGICEGNSDTLKASGANSYVWSNGATTSSIVVNPTSSKTYTVVGTSMNCQGDTTFTVTVFPTPTITITGNHIICFDSSTVLTASGASVYSWANSSGLSCTSCPNPVVNPTVTTTYTIIGKDIHGCSNSTTDTVIVIPSPTVTATVNKKQPCKGVPVTLTANGTPGGGTYLWLPINKTGQSVVDTPLTNKVYTVVYTTECGTATDTVSVSIAVVPTLFLEANPRKGCAPFCTQFSSIVVPANASIVSWLWDFGDGDTSSVKNPAYCFNTPGKYTITLSAQTAQGCGTSAQTTNMITVNPGSHADFSYSPDPVTIIDPLVSFTDKSTGSQILSWTWTFGDNRDSTSYVQDPIHTYQDTGRFCVKLAIEDINGCVDSNKQCIEVGTQFTFYIPSAFSPNNDGINDDFTPIGNDIENYEMYIFDRWGLKIFYTNDILIGWNGGVNNKGSKICQEDVYVYLINVTDRHGVQHHYTGRVTLLK